MIHIRQAKAEDVTSIMNLIAGVVPVMQTAGNFQWDDQYPNPAVFMKDIGLKQLWLAEKDGEIAGVAAITTDQDAEYADVGWDINEAAIVTHRLAVSVHHQCLGIARALLNQAERVALERGITVLRIDTNSENKATQKLFPAMGYTYAGEISLHFRTGLRFYCYEKRL